MNLRKYYASVKSERQKLSGPFVFVTSLATPNGGVEGRVSQVDLDLASRMIVDQVARESEPAEIEAFLAQQEAERAKAKEEDLRQRVRITLVNEAAYQVESHKPQKEPKQKG